MIEKKDADGVLVAEKPAILEDESDKGEEPTSTPQYVLDQEAGISRLAPRRYNPESGRWEAAMPANAATPHADAGANAAISTDGFKLVTYNVWFSEKWKRERATKLFAILEAQDAHVMCLQEVTPELLGWLRDEAWVQDKYILSDSIGTTLRGTFAYGVVTCVAKTVDIGSMCMHWLPTNMCRSVLVLTCPLAEGKELKIATAHLESMNNADMRAAQMDTIFGDDVLGCGEACLLVGDMNFGDGAKEEAHVPPAFADSWKALNVGADLREGVTMPFDDGTGADTRIDRVFATTSVFVPVEFERLGMSGRDPVSEAPGLADGVADVAGGQEGEAPKKVSFAKVDVPPRSTVRSKIAEINPSDHYGIACRFVPRAWE